MKITSFYPTIVTPNYENTVKLFEELGFEERHSPVADTLSGEVVSTIMKNADGFCVDVADVKAFPQDMTYIRLNVDNFDEAYDILTAHGFKNTKGGVMEVNKSKSATMESPSGFRISLIQHIK